MISYAHTHSHILQVIVVIATAQTHKHKGIYRRDKPPYTVVVSTYDLPLLFGMVQFDFEWLYTNVCAGEHADECVCICADKHTLARTHFDLILAKQFGNWKIW